MPMSLGKTRNPNNLIVMVCGMLLLGSAKAGDFLNANCVTQDGWGVRIYDPSQIDAYKDAKGIKSKREITYQIDLTHNTAIIKADYYVLRDVPVIKLSTGDLVMSAEIPGGTFGNAIAVHSLMPDEEIGFIQVNTYPADKRADVKALVDADSMICIFLKDQ